MNPVYKLDHLFNKWTSKFISFLVIYFRKLGPKPRRPTTTEIVTSPPKKELNTIEGMLQMIGLCQGHEI